MNLIEQLGGYEIAKSIYSKIKHRRESSTHRSPCKSLAFDVGILRIELLEHRRANNIFEIRDEVVYQGSAGLDGLFEIESLTRTGKPKTVKAGRFGNFPCRYCEVRHATDEEIKAGRRL